MDEKKKPVAAVDFDGVIYKGPWAGSDAPLDPAMIVAGTREALTALREKFSVVIFTCRAYTGYTVYGDFSSGHAAKVAEFLRVNHIPFDSVTTFPGKISAAVYIDDKAVTFRGNWAGTVKQVMSFRHWLAKG